MIEWNQNFKNPVDKDSPDDMEWLFKRAEERAKTYGIEGVNYKLTMGVIKNIIPAIASTNALISAACVNECIKILTDYNPVMDNYMQFLGQTRVTCSLLRHEANPTCLVCARETHEYKVGRDQKLEDFVEELKTKLNLKEPCLTNCSNQKILTAGGIFAQKVAHQREMTFG